MYLLITSVVILSPTVRTKYPSLQSSPPLGYFFKKFFNPFFYLLFQNPLAILWNPDKMIFDVIYRMSRSSYSHAGHSNIIRAFGTGGFIPPPKGRGFCPPLFLN